MPKTINPTAAWHDTLNIPRPGEGVKAAGVELPFSDLLANDKYLQGRVDALEAALAKLASSTPTPGGGTTPGTGGETQAPTNPVTASFIATPSSTVGLVSFSATASSTAGSITSYDWTFGDGTAASGQAVSHTYSSVEPFTVQLTVHDTASNSVQVSQQVTPPAATGTTPGGSSPNTPSPAPSLISDFTYTDHGGGQLTFVALPNNATNGITSYLWDFGDGTTSNQEKPVKTYAASGSYTVKLTLTDGKPSTATGARILEVHLQ